MISRQEVISFIAMIVECCATQAANFTTYLKSNTRVGLTLNKYAKVRQYLDFDLVRAIQDFNIALKRRLQVIIVIRIIFLRHR